MIESTMPAQKTCSEFCPACPRMRPGATFAMAPPAGSQRIASQASAPICRMRVQARLVLSEPSCTESNQSFNAAMPVGLPLEVFTTQAKTMKASAATSSQTRRGARMPSCAARPMMTPRVKTTC